MQSLIDFVLFNLNYWWVFVFMTIESSFIPFPSEVVVPPAAFLSMTPDSPMNILLVVLVATLGADMGALINYYLAKWLGRPIVYKFADSRIGHMCLIDRAKVEHAEAYFREHGAASTFFGRLIPLCDSSSAFLPDLPACPCAHSCSTPHSVPASGTACSPCWATSFTASILPALRSRWPTWLRATATKLATSFWHWP